MRVFLIGIVALSGAALADPQTDRIMATNACAMGDRQACAWLDRQDKPWSRDADEDEEDSNVHIVGRSMRTDGVGWVCEYSDGSVRVTTGRACD